MTNTTPLIPAKAITPAEQSDAIVVSFQPEWRERLLSREFSVVIRKRIPRQRDFGWLYFHLNSPVSALYARARIERIFEASIDEAVALADDIHLSASEIRSYVGEANRIGCYVLGAVQFAKVPLSIAALAAKMKYYPPQSFFIFSRRAKELVDALAAFT